MKMVAGLGNPGLAYKNSRHNLGFTVVDGLLRSFKIRPKRDTACGCLKSTLIVKGVDIVLCKPLSYMNLSGDAISCLIKRNRLSLEDILVICDDVNLELGRIKIKARGSAGGHKGLASIIKSLSSESFPRLRIGIARPRTGRGLSEYVLSPFTLQEKRALRESLGLAREAALYWVENGTGKTMNKFN